MKKELRKWRVREELKIILLKTMSNFKSKEEPGTKLTQIDEQLVLSELLTRKLQNK